MSLHSSVFIVVIVLVILALNHAFQDSPVKFHNKDFFIFSLVNLFDDNSVISQFDQVLSELMVVTENDLCYDGVTLSMQASRSYWKVRQFSSKVMELMLLSSFSARMIAICLWFLFRLFQIWLICSSVFCDFQLGRGKNFNNLVMGMQVLLAFTKAKLSISMVPRIFVCLTEGPVQCNLTVLNRSDDSQSRQLKQFSQLVLHFRVQEPVV